MKKGYLSLLRSCILCLGMCICFLAECQTVRADLILDDQYIDGSHAIFFDQQPLRVIRYNGTVVWRAGADITYMTDAGVSEVHFVPYGQTTLAVTGSKSGYEFAGWRTDKTASGDVLKADLCTGDEKTLYAVFRKAVTVSCYNGSSTKQASVGYIYYNNGNVSNPEFTIPQAPVSGWTARGWAAGQAANAGVSYTALNHTVLTADTTLYGVYQKTITASFNGNGADGGSVAALSGTAYYNSIGNTINPSFRMPGNGFTKSGHAWAGWAQGSTGIIRTAGENVTLSGDTAFSATWQTSVQNFGYSGGVQPWPVPATGYYKLEVWGASGGNAMDWNGTIEGTGGSGGYSVGYVYLTAGQTLYIGIGGRGTDRHSEEEGMYLAGGWNGGGDSGTSGRTNSGSGGGATHIALGVNRGVLAGYAGNTSEILLVAGGGGGGCRIDVENEGDDDLPSLVNAPGGNGGGLTGGDGTVVENNVGDPQGYANGLGASQTGPGGSGGGAGYPPGFGTGGGRPTNHGGGGGGGWYGGGAGWGCPGGGGSGRINGCASTLTYNGTTYTSSTAMSSHTGNGSAVITYLGR